jgi:regulator of sigma E protease
MISVLVSVLALLVVLGVLVFVHELGHFLAAKAAGIWVHRFALGIGKPIRALSFRRGETEYAICWLPLGGYVKMASREEDPASAALEGGPASANVPPDRVFEAKPVWQRMIVILAGVTMNVLFAWLMFSGLNYLQGMTVVPITTIGNLRTTDLPTGAEELARLAPGDRIVRIGGKPVATWEDVASALVETSADTIAIDVTGKPPVILRLHRDALEARFRVSQAIAPFWPPVISQVVPRGPGARAGVKLGDTLVAINGRPITQWQQAVQVIESHPDEDLTLTVTGLDGRRDLAAHTLAETVKDSTGERRVGRLRLGSALPRSHQPLGLGRSLTLGARQTLTSSTQLVRGIRGMVSGRVSTREVGGPIAIGIAAGQAIRVGLDMYIVFMAIISVNLAVINLLPIPVLDGGQFLFLAAEAVLRRPVSVKLRERLTLVGLVLIGLLMILAFSNDFRRLLGV